MLPSGSNSSSEAGHPRASLVVASCSQPMFMNLLTTEGISGHRKVGFGSALTPAMQGACPKFKCGKRVRSTSVRNVSETTLREIRFRTDAGCSAKPKRFRERSWFYHTRLLGFRAKSASEPTRVAARNRNDFANGRGFTTRVFWDFARNPLPNRRGLQRETETIFANSSLGRSHARGRGRSVAALRRFFRRRRGGRTPGGRFRAQQGECRSSQSLGEEYPWLRVDESYHRHQEQQENRRGASSL